MNCGNASMLDTEVLLDNPHCNIDSQKRRENLLASSF